MRFILLTQYYPPETGAPQNRLSDLARRLSEAGHSVAVLTAKPNYPTAVIHQGFEKGFWNERTEGSVRVIHCWLYPSKSKRIIPRLLNYFSFVFSSALIGLAKLRESDVLLVESPPLFLGLTAVLLSRAKRAQMVFNVSDLYPETAVALGYLREGISHRVLLALEGWCYRRSLLVTGQTEGIVASVRRRYPDVSVHLLTNGVDTRQFEDLSSRGQNETFVIGYAGVLGHAQALSKVLDAAAILDRCGAKVAFEIFGDGPLRHDLEDQVRAAGISNVRFGGHRSRSEVLEAMRQWDAGVVPLVNTEVMAGALPSKMFEIMAAGLPVVLFSPEGEASRLIARAAAGVWVSSDDSQGLAEAIRSLALDPDGARRMGEAARSYVLKHYDRANIARAFLERVESLVQTRRGSTAMEAR